MIDNLRGLVTLITAIIALASAVGSFFVLKYKVEENSRNLQKLKDDLQDVLHARDLEDRWQRNQNDHDDIYSRLKKTDGDHDILTALNTEIKLQFEHINKTLDKMERMMDRMLENGGKI